MVLTGGGGNVVAMMGKFDVCCKVIFRLYCCNGKSRVWETFDASRKLKPFVTDTGVPRLKP
jgi:hypothetical protein